MHFGERSQNFIGNVPAFIAEKFKKMKEILFWTILFTSKCSFGLIDQTFDNLAGVFCQKSRTFLL